MNNNEDFKSLVENAFNRKLKDQILLNKEIHSGGKIIEIENVEYITPTLQNTLNILELLSDKGTNVNFAGEIRLSVKCNSTDSISHSRKFAANNIKARYNTDKQEFVFLDIISFNILD